MHVLRLTNRNLERKDDREAPREAAIPIEAARVCSVCWTVHQSDECPECKARQWQNLLELMQTMGLEPWVEAAERGVLQDIARGSASR